jgi:hypothetical protein
MEMLFRPIQHDPIEIIMGQAIWFSPINGIDGISATANTEGFTPLTSIANSYEWDGNLIRKATHECNAKAQIAIVKQVKPTLLLVPKTKGNSDTEFLIQDLISAINEIKIENLHFTHYSFIQNKLPKNEIKQIFQTFEKNIQNSLKKVIWDIDRRHKESLIRLNISCKSIN